MIRYGVETVTPGTRLVHNFHPGPQDDPGRNRRFGVNGFRYWIADAPGNDCRCYCGWLDGREHYGTGSGGRIVLAPRADVCGT